MRTGGGLPFPGDGPTTVMRRAATDSSPSHRKRPSAQVSSPCGPTKSPPAPSPASRRRAPSSIVLPAPVSPVHTTIPGPGLMRAERITPRLDTDNSSSISYPSWNLRCKAAGNDRRCRVMNCALPPAVTVTDPPGPTRPISFPSTVTPTGC